MAGNKKFRELRMAFVKFHVVGGNPGEHVARLLDTLVLVRQRDQDFVIPRFRNQAPFPTRIAEIIQKFRLFFFLNLIRIPGADEKIKLLAVQ